MIPRESDIKIKGSLGGAKVAMEFDSHSIAHIMGVLTDLYSDPELAIVREYATNAMDSHVAAGCTKPIEVSTGSKISPYLVVQDYGLGLSVDELVNVYSKYGASTRRDTDAQTGMLGLGSKAGLTYAPQFVVTAVKNGVKATVMISRDSSGVGCMEIVDTASTNESNGVCIRIPLHDSNSVTQKAQKFFSYWPAGSVLLNGKEPTSLQSGFEVMPGTFLFPRDYWSERDTIVMGNVPYSIDESQGLWRMVHFAEMGAVDFTPNRERLHFTARTKQYMHDLQQQVINAFDDKIEQQVAAQPNKPAALREACKVADMRWVECEYAGEKIPRYITFDLQFRPDYTRGAFKPGRTVGCGIVIKNPVLLVHGSPETFSNWDRTKIRRYIEANHPNVLEVYFSSQPSEWLEYDIDWQQIAAFRMPRNAGSRQQRIPFKVVLGFDAFDDIFAEDIDSSKPVYYITDKRESNLDSMTRVLPGTIIYVSQNRLAKFLRDFPNAMPARQEWLRVSAEFFSEYTIEEYMTDYGLWRADFVAKLDASKVDDPDLKWLIQARRTPGRTVASKPLWCCASATGFDTASVTKRIRQIADRYPLLQQHINAPLGHREIYVNAIYGGMK